MFELLAAGAAGLLNPTVLIVLLITGILAAGIRFLQNKINLPDSVVEVAEMLGWDELAKAYLLAEKEVALPNVKRDIAVAYLMKIAKERVGFTIDHDTLNLLIEFVVNVVNHEGKDKLAKLAGVSNLNNLASAL